MRARSRSLRRRLRRWRARKGSKRMPDPLRCVLPGKLPTPRKAVLGMAPYSPPTGNRIEKMRLDFNENTVGCSPGLGKALCDALSQERLAVYPDYARVKQTLSTFFKVAPEELLLTNGTDEAVQVLINTYVD